MLVRKDFPRFGRSSLLVSVRGINLCYAMMTGHDKRIGEPLLGLQRCDVIALCRFRLNFAWVRIRRRCLFAGQLGGNVMQ